MRTIPEFWRCRKNYHPRVSIVFSQRYDDGIAQKCTSNGRNSTNELLCKGFRGPQRPNIISTQTNQLDSNGEKKFQHKSPKRFKISLQTQPDFCNLKQKRFFLHVTKDVGDRFPKYETKNLGGL